MTRSRDGGVALAIALIDGDGIPFTFRNIEQCPIFLFHVAPPWGDAFAAILSDQHRLRLKCK